MTEQQDFTWSGRTWGIILGVSLVVILAFNFMDGGVWSSRGGSGFTTSRSICEDLWNENSGTASSPYMTKERYISNCMETNRDLSDGRLDGR